MVKRMLVDANHPEETRVVVLSGTRLEEFDLETSTKKQNKGNIYLAKVIRVEPSLQAAFVDYGGNRHGFLAFSEIHPDYYQIPVADREALLAEAQAHDEQLGDGEGDDVTEPPSDSDSETGDGSSGSEIGDAADAPAESAPDSRSPDAERSSSVTANWDQFQVDQAFDLAFANAAAAAHDQNTEESTASYGQHDDNHADSLTEQEAGESGSLPVKKATEKAGVEEVGGEDEAEENFDVHRRKFVASRRYKIQEVIKRRQILLVQVVKEERGTKGAALTTYLSLAGRYCVLMPNSSRGGGVSRRITNAKDRRRLKSILGDLKISDHMAVILRTAGAERSKAEVKRDFEYLQRTWNLIRELTMESRAPALIHEEANLIRRSIRDIYTRDIEEILVEGEAGYRAAKEFMKTLTPSHAKKVKRYKDDSIPLLHRYQVESQLDAMHSPAVQLKSGGSIVFGQTEALVAIDVNSGRATKERHIEETALKTNLEAAEEIARQLRLRDLAGLVVIDFIDMDENRNNHAVERKLKEALKSDRARIQVGRISHFGLLELSRQRLRPSLIEANFETCKTCAGTGLIRSIESTAIQTLRAIEEEGLRHRTSELTVTVHPDVALYILNYKRSGLESIQKRYEMNVFVLGDETLVPPDMKMERVKGDASKPTGDQAKAEDDTDETVWEEGSADTKQDDEQDGGKKRRRRRRRKRRSEGEESDTAASPPAEESATSDRDATTDDTPSAGQDDAGDDAEPQKKTRRRGRRGGRRRKRDDRSGAEAPAVETSTDQPNDGASAPDQPGEPTPTTDESAQVPPQETPQTQDRIPVQTVPALEPRPPSRFLDVIRRGADVLRPSGSNIANMDQSDPSLVPEQAERTLPEKAPEPPSTSPPVEEQTPADTGSLERFIF